MASPKPKASPQDNLLCCPICMDIYKSPRMLPCQHTLCESCLHSYIVNKSRERVLVSDFPCPVCRTSTPAPRAFTRIDTWSTLFPLNHLLVSLLDSSFQEIIDKGDSFGERCGEHPGKAIEFFCTDHDINICSKCFKNSHRQCDVIDIEDHVEFTSRFSIVKSDLTNVQKYINDAIFQLKTNIDQLMSQKNAILSEVKDFKNKVEALLNNFETDIKDQVNVQHDGEVVVLKAQCEKYERVKSEVDTSESSLNELPIVGDISQSLESLTAIEKDLKGHISFLSGSHSSIKLIKLEFAIEEKLLELLNSLSKIGNVYVRQFESNISKPPEIIPRANSQNDSFTSTVSNVQSPMNVRHLSPRSATTTRPSDSACQLGNNQEKSPPRSQKQPKRPLTVPIESTIPTPIVRPRAERPEVRGIPPFLPRSSSSPVNEPRPNAVNTTDKNQQQQQHHETHAEQAGAKVTVGSTQTNLEDVAEDGGVYEEPNAVQTKKIEGNCNTLPLTKDSTRRHHVWQYVNIGVDPTNEDPSDESSGLSETREVKRSVFRQPFRTRSSSASDVNQDPVVNDPLSASRIVRNFHEQQKQNGSICASPLYENTCSAKTAFSSLSRRKSDKKPLSETTRKCDSFPKQCVKVNEIGGQIESDTHDCTITGSVELPDKRLVLVDCNNSRVKLFGSDFAYQAHLDMGKEPWNVAMVTNDEVAVTIPLEKSIHLIRIMTSSMSTSRCIITRRECWGICHVEDKFIITTKDNGNIVVFLDKNGRELQIVNFASRENPNILRPVSITAATHENVLYVCCEGQTGTKGSVVRMSLRGDVLYVFTNKELDRPYSTTVDKEGNVYVTAIRSANVVWFSDGGTNSTTVLSRDKGLCRPQHIQSLSSDKHVTFLLTERRSDTITVYEVK